MDPLVDPSALRDEGVLDAAQPSGDPAGDAGLFLDLPDGRLLVRFTVLDVALGQRPTQPAAAVQPPDQRTEEVPSSVRTTSPPAEVSSARRRRWGDPATGRRAVGMGRW